MCHSRTTHLNLSWILPRSWQGGVTWNLEDGARASPVRRRQQSGSGESGGNGPCPKATPLIHWHPLSLVRALHPSSGSWLLSNVWAPQGWETGSPEGGAIAFPQVDALRKGVLHPRKMVSAVQENDSVQGSQQLSPQLSPQSPKSQSFLTWLQSPLPSLRQSPE